MIKGYETQLAKFEQMKFCECGKRIFGRFQRCFKCGHERHLAQMRQWHRDSEG
jgi:hypothetical protein